MVKHFIATIFDWRISKQKWRGRSLELADCHSFGIHCHKLYVALAKSSESDEVGGRWAYCTQHAMAPHTQSVGIVVGMFALSNLINELSSTIKALRISGFQTKFIPQEKSTEKQ